jgi:hypothetical protein
MHFFLAKSVDRPSYSIKTISAKYLYSHTFKFPTRPVWNPITITFYDAQVADDVRTYLNNPKINGAGTDIENVNQKIFDTSKALFKQSTQFFFYDFLRKSGYYDPEEYERDDQLLRFRSYNFKRNMIESLVGSNGSNLDFDGTTANNTLTYKTLNITEYAPDGTPQEMWRIANPLITDVKFDKLDYSADDIPLITVTVEYDWASLEPQTALFNGQTTDVLIKEFKDNVAQIKKDTDARLAQIAAAQLGKEWNDRFAGKDGILQEDEAKFAIAQAYAEAEDAAMALYKGTPRQLKDLIFKNDEGTGLFGIQEQRDSKTKEILQSLEQKALTGLETEVRGTPGTSAIYLGEDGEVSSLFATNVDSAKKLIDLTESQLKSLSPEKLQEFAKKTGIDISKVTDVVADERAALESALNSGKRVIKIDQDTNFVNGMLAEFDASFKAGMVDSPIRNPVTMGLLDDAAYRKYQENSMEVASDIIGRIDQALDDNPIGADTYLDQKITILKNGIEVQTTLREQLGQERKKYSDEVSQARELWKVLKPPEPTPMTPADAAMMGDFERGESAALVDGDINYKTRETIKAFQANPQSLLMFEPEYIVSSDTTIPDFNLKSKGLDTTYNYTGLYSSDLKFHVNILDYLPTESE